MKTVLYSAAFLIVAIFAVVTGADTGSIEMQTVTLKPGWNIVSTPRVLSAHIFSAPETAENFDIYVLSAEFAGGWATMGQLGQTEFEPLFGYFIRNKTGSNQTLEFQYKSAAEPNERMFSRTFGVAGWYSIGVANPTYAIPQGSNDPTDRDNISKILNALSGSYSTVLDLTHGEFSADPDGVRVSTTWKAVVAQNADALNDFRDLKGYAVYITKGGAVYDGFANAGALEPALTPVPPIAPGTLTVTKHSLSPSGQLAAGATDVLLAKFTLHASNEDMEARRIDLQIVKSGTAPDTALTSNVAIRSGDGSVTYVTISAATNTAIYTDTATRFDLSTYIQLKSNVDTVLDVYGNVSSNAEATDSYQVRIRNVYVKRLSSIDFTDLPDTSTYTVANTLTVVTFSATLAKNTAFDDSTVPPSLNGAKIGSFVVQDGTAEDARISSIQLDFVGADDATTVSNVVLKVNGVQQGTSVDSPNLTGNTYSVSINVPQSTPVIIDVFADVKSDASGTIQLRVPTDGLTLVGLETSNSITRPSAGTLDLQTITFGAGSLQITKDSSSPVEQILTPANGVLLGNWKFEARNEDLLLSKVTFTVRAADGGSGSTQTANYGTLTLKDGSTTLATGSLVNENVVFSGFGLTVPASGNKVLSLYADLTGSGTQSPGLIAVWTITSDTTPTDIDVTGSAGQLAVDDIDGDSDTATADTTFATSTRFLYHNSKPVIAAASNTPSGTKTPQAGQEIFIFTITNSGTRDMRVGSLTATVSTAGGAAGTHTVNTFDLYDGTQRIAQGTKDGQAVSSPNDRMGANSSSIAFSFTTENDLSGFFDNFVISAGATKTLTLKADTSAIRTGLTTSNVTLNARIAGTTGYSSGSSWNTGDFAYFYTPVFGSENTVAYAASDSYPINGGTITY